MTKQPYQSIQLTAHLSIQLPYSWGIIVIRMMHSTSSSSKAVSVNIAIILSLLFTSSHSFHPLHNTVGRSAVVRSRITALQSDAGNFNDMTVKDLKDLLRAKVCTEHMYHYLVHMYHYLVVTDRIMEYRLITILFEWLSCYDPVVSENWRFST